MTKSFEVYTSKDSSYTDKYSIYTSVAILTGSTISNLFSVFLISVLGEDNPMTIPYVCIARNIFDIVALYMMFWVQDSFYVSIIGFYIQQIVGEGWYAPALMMLQSVVPPEVASLTIGLSLLVVCLDYTVSIMIFSAVVSAYNFTTDCCNGSFG